MLLNEKTIGIIGMKRSGKTWFTRKLTEGIEKKCVIWDTIGAIKAKGSAHYIVVPTNLEKDAVAWGLLMLETKAKSISVNLEKLTQDEIVQFADISLKIAADGLKNKVFVFDEIAELLPQSYKQSKEVQRLIRHGGNMGNTFIFNTQRPAYVNKNTFNLIDVLICFRLVYPRDIEVLKEILSDTGKEDLSETIHTIKNLKQGEHCMFIFGAPGGA